VSASRMGVVTRVLVFSLLLAACSGGSSPSGQTSGNKRGAVNPNGTLSVGYDFSSEFTNTFDPAMSHSECDSLLTEQIYGFLLTRNADDQVQPGLASSWTVGNDSLTLDLRPGLKFSDGEAYDAQAVKEGLLHNKSNSMFTELHSITGIDVLGPTSLRVNLSNNSGVRLLYALTQSSGEIPAPSTLNGDFSDPIGAGPFEFVSYSEGSQLILRRNPGYFDATAYKLGGVKFVQVGAGPPSVLALRSGSVDLVRVQPHDYDSIDHVSGFAPASRPSSDYLQVEFRFTGPFADKLVRQAVNLALNRSQINTVVLGGKGEVATQPFDPSSPIYVPGLVGSNHYDPTEAKRLLAEAGYPNGFSFTLVIPGGGISIFEELAALMQSDLGAVGIKMTIMREIGSDLYTSFLINKQGNALAAEQTDNPYPPLLLGQFAANTFSAVQTNAVNPTINTILQEADNSSSLATIDSFGRQGNEVDVNEALEVPIAFLPQQVAWNDAVVGGTVTAPLNTCAPDNLAGVTVSG
jgi:ABC-type transport system substrate-binding protein